MKPLVLTSKKTALQAVLVPVLISLLLSSCIAYKEPEFKTVKNITIAKFDQKEIELQADAVLFNPNTFSLTLTEIDLALSVNDIEVNNIKQLRSSKVKANSDFEVPLSIKFPTEKLYDNFFTALQYMTSNKKVGVKYNGVIKMKAAGIKFNVPIDYTGELKLSK
ncbi:LEA type 2 family protein [Flammeovirgaceae bacterium SG7u.111]|nr:LEA type 2 family protein [Flammeovirgaceae bacterium SG7u.132]WPO33155.1 LEA type 2 family protein [Flammeovirgaceae bacterium SG7u.111]